MGRAKANSKFSTSLSSAVNDAITTTFNVNAVPTHVPCILIAEPGTAKEEKFKVTAKGVSSLTVIRGYDGTTATTHSLGASIVDYNSPTVINEIVDTLDANFNDDNTAKTTALVTLTGTQTLTNKTLTAPVVAGGTYSNIAITDSASNVMAKSLKSATTTVDVSAATAPTTGQVLTATSATTATWQTNASGSVSQVDMDNAGGSGTSSATFADITGADVSVTIPSGQTANIVLMAHVQAYTDAARRYGIQWHDGTSLIGTELYVTLPAGNARTLIANSCLVTGATAGAKTYTLQHRNLEGSGTITGETINCIVFTLPG